MAGVILWWMHTGLPQSKMNHKASISFRMASSYRAFSYSYTDFLDFLAFPALSF